MFAWRNLVVMMMAAILPASLFAQGVAAATLHSHGQGVFVDGSPAPSSAAISSLAISWRRKNKPLARIEASGSSINETLLQFEDQELVRDHGSLAVLTARELRVRVGCLTVTPVNPPIETTCEVFDREVKVKAVNNPSRSSRGIVGYASRNHGRKNVPPRP